MVIFKNSCLIAFCLSLCSCRVSNESSKFGFTEGFYKSRLYHKKLKKIYIIPSDDSIRIFSEKSIKKGFVDTTKKIKIIFPQNTKPLQFEDYYFKKNSFDLDILSVLFKYRPSVKNFPRQLNTTFNGAAYFGYRTDVYQLSYKQTPLKQFKRNITHFGYSVGVFTCLGSARIDQSVTLNAIDYEYDGVVYGNGIAVILGLNNFSFGLTGGIDFLLDKNKKFWVNQKKPSIGLSIGLNIN